MTAIGTDRPSRSGAGWKAPAVRLALLLAVIAAAVLAVIETRLDTPGLGGGYRMTIANGVARLDGPGLGAGGATVQALAAPGGAPAVPLDPDLLVEDPDMLASYDAAARLVAQQGQLMAVLDAALAAGRPMTAELGPDAPVPALALPVTPRAAPGSLPGVFWVQIVCGTLVLMVAAFFLALRRPDTAREGVLGFVLAGVGVGGAAFAAAIYSTRSPAIAPGLLGAASVGNHVMTFLFGMGMIALFARYPRRLLPAGAIVAAAVLLAGAIIAFRLQWLPHPVVRPQHLTAVIFVTILALVWGQTRATRGRPADRAALRWLGLSFLLGSGVFVLLVALPVALERQSVMSQGMAFIPLCAIYVGTALALARYRLFDLDRWAWRLMFHMAVVLALVVVDLTVMLTASLSGPASLASAVVLVGLIYFPLRDQVFDRWFAPPRSDPAAVYGAAVSVALQVGPAAKAQAWRNLLDRLFRPAEVQPAPVAPPAPTPAAEGLSLDLPAQSGAPALRLSLAEGGRRLFNAQDAALAAQLAALIETAERDRARYEAAVETERLRIARDLHDDVGANLLSALHARSDTARQEFLVEALSDLRQIASGLAGRPVTLERLVAELRAESRSRVEAAGRKLDWPLGSADDCETLLDYATLRNLTALHREALSNALRHGGAGPIGVRSEVAAGRLHHRVQNPLPLPEPAAAATAPQGHQPDRRQGQGLANMAARARAAGGALQAGPAGDLWQVALDMPLAPPTAFCPTTPPSPHPAEQQPRP